MAGKEQFSAAEMIEALQATRGMPTVAARRLGCSYNTVANYIKNYPTVAAAQKEAKEALGDQATLTLYDQALGRVDPQTGKRLTEPNLTALIFLLKTQFKDRGYTERIEIVGGLDLNLINETARALTDAGVDAQEFFQKAIERAKQKQNADNG